MIPANIGTLISDFEFVGQPGKSYKMSQDNCVSGQIDGRAAVEQTIYKILNTERYDYPIYSWNYGVELEGLYGKPLSYVYPELERRITEALCQDSRVEGVKSFLFTRGPKGVINVAFIVRTVYGEVQIDKEVSI